MSKSNNRPEFDFRKKPAVTARATSARCLDHRQRRGDNTTPSDPLVSRFWPFMACDVVPLAWWRTLPSDLFSEVEHLLLCATLNRITVIRDSRVFAAALRGDAAAAIALAIVQMPVKTTGLTVDLAMTAVLRVALEGDAAAALVLSHVLGRTRLHHPFATELAASWLALSRRRAQRNWGELSC